MQRPMSMSVNMDCDSRTENTDRIGCIRLMGVDHREQGDKSPQNLERGGR